MSAPGGGPPGPISSGPNGSPSGPIGGPSGPGPISPGGGISPGPPGISPIASSTDWPAISNASAGDAPSAIAWLIPSVAAVDIVSTISCGAPISVITAPAASIPAAAASAIEPPSAITALYASAAASPAASAIASIGSIVPSGPIPISSAIIISLILKFYLCEYF